ncbi:Holliday junction resolvase RuvX [Aliikangiella coralliicola]|uniref:Putative pre-16S rRNA nuclease n=1 Tax=Aliikangiella coralliicola TaxID=2592383 RepID=A0A545UHS2_9GAMM|nr:Holliday junction resolvase RuvX [Aliikangiella coralliicola]TQV89016.1 Holliday junction resolvase RuvX [Aliikangiella coralliicola]
MSQVIAFDFGLARIGVAVGQAITQTASPLDTLKANDGVPNWTQVEILLKHWQPKKVLVGEPFNMDGTDQEITLRARKFANRVHGRFGVQVEMVDERLSSAAARDELFEFGGYQKIKKSQVDSIAAALILESWFSNQNS